MLECFRPGIEDMAELKALYLECFDEDKAAADYMFQNMLTPKNAYAVRCDGEIASALYLLPCNILIDGESVKAHYLMGAATRRKYRNMGVMSELIAFANNKAKADGDEFSVLEPASESLYSYYGRFGYKKAYTSAVFDYYLPDNSKKNIKTCHLTKSSFDIWSSLRFNICKSIRGSVHWSKAHLVSCAEINRIYGGGISGFDYGYALYTMGENGVFVDELFCLPEYLDGFLYSLALALGVERLTVRCPSFLKSDGRSVPMGMILPLKEKNFSFDSFNINAYLGLSLD